MPFALPSRSCPNRCCSALIFKSTRSGSVTRTFAGSMTARNILWPNVLAERRAFDAYAQLAYSTTRSQVFGSALQRCPILGAQQDIPKNSDVEMHGRSIRAHPAHAATDERRP